MDERDLVSLELLKRIAERFVAGREPSAFEPLQGARDDAADRGSNWGSDEELMNLLTRLEDMAKSEQWNRYSQNDAPANPAADQWLAGPGTPPWDNYLQQAPNQQQQGRVPGAQWGNRNNTQWVDNLGWNTGGGPQVIPGLGGGHQPGYAPGPMGPAINTGPMSFPTWNDNPQTQQGGWSLGAGGFGDESLNQANPNFLPWLIQMLNDSLQGEFPPEHESNWDWWDQVRHSPAIGPSPNQQRTPNDNLWSVKSNPQEDAWASIVDSLSGYGGGSTGALPAGRVADPNNQHEEFLDQKFPKLKWLAQQPQRN